MRRRDGPPCRPDERREPGPYLKLVHALVLARTGRLEEAAALLDHVDTRQAREWATRRWPSRTVTVAPLQAAVLVALDRAQATIDVLRSAMDRDPEALLYDLCYPELRSLERDPRYVDLLRRTGVPMS